PANKMVFVRADGSVGNVSDSTKRRVWHRLRRQISLRAGPLHGFDGMPKRSLPLLSRGMPRYDDVQPEVPRLKSTLGPATM
ncbi:MAG TPA: hypothetical protein VNO55_08535, partial [Polyangia bacterium]|nr:hypothetical protein [Polyangia bacterium]